MYRNAKYFSMQCNKTKLQRNISLKQNILLCMMKLQCVHYALSMLSMYRNAKYFAMQCYRQNCSEIFHSSKIFYCVWWNYNVYIMPSLCCKCTEMQTISLCNVIRQNCSKIFHSSTIFYFVWWNYNVYIMPSPCCKCTEMQNISLCNVIDKTSAKYFTQAKYFTVYDETTMCTLCPLYVVNVQ